MFLSTIWLVAFLCWTQASPVQATILKARSGSKKAPTNVDRLQGTSQSSSESPSDLTTHQSDYPIRPNAETSFGQHQELSEEISSLISDDSVSPDSELHGSHGRPSQRQESLRRRSRSNLKMPPPPPSKSQYLRSVGDTLDGMQIDAHDQLEYSHLRPDVRHLADPNIHNKIDDAFDAALKTANEGRAGDALSQGLDAHKHLQNHIRRFRVRINDEADIHDEEKLWRLVQSRRAQQQHARPDSARLQQIWTLAEKFHRKAGELRDQASKSTESDLDEHLALHRTVSKAVTAELVYLHTIGGASMADANETRARTPAWYNQYSQRLHSRRRSNMEDLNMHQELYHMHFAAEESQEPDRMDSQSSKRRRLQRRDAIPSPTRTANDRTKQTQGGKKTKGTNMDKSTGSKQQTPKLSPTFEETVAHGLNGDEKKYLDDLRPFLKPHLQAQSSAGHGSHGNDMRFVKPISLHGGDIKLHHLIESGYIAQPSTKILKTKGKAAKATETDQPRDSRPQQMRRKRKSTATESAPLNRIKSEEVKVKTEEPIVKTEEPIVKTEEPTIKSEEHMVKSEEPTVKSEEPTIKSEETGPSKTSSSRKRQKKSNTASGKNSNTSAKTMVGIVKEEPHAPTPFDHPFLYAPHRINRVADDTLNWLNEDGDHEH